MKLSISRNVLNHLTTVLAQTGSTYTVELADKGLIDLEHNEKGFFSDILFFKNIKEKASKTVTVTKTETEVTIALNEELVKDAITLVGTYYQRLAKHVIGAVIEAKAFKKDIEVFQNKWKEEDKQKEEARKALLVVLNRQQQQQQTATTPKVESETNETPDFLFTISSRLDMAHIKPRQGKGVTIYKDTLEAIKKGSNKDLGFLAKELNLPVRALKLLKAKLLEV